MRIKNKLSDEKYIRVHLSVKPSELKLIGDAKNKTSFRSRSQFIVYQSVKASKRVLNFVR